MSSRGKLTVRLPEDNLDFVRRYAADRGLTVTEVLDRFLTRLRRSEQARPIHPRVEQISGLIPVDVDVRALYHDYLLEKHQ